MSMLDLNFDNVVEPTAVEDGEHELRIVECSTGTSSTGKGDYIMAKLEIPAFPTSKNINHVMMLPGANDDEKTRNNRLLQIQRFYEAFKVDYKSGPVSLDDLAGLTGWGILKTETSDEYGDQNRVARFVAGN